MSSHSPGLFFEIPVVQLVHLHLHLPHLSLPSVAFVFFAFSTIVCKVNRLSAVFAMTFVQPFALPLNNKNPDISVVEFITIRDSLPNSCCDLPTPSPWVIFRKFLVV